MNKTKTIAQLKPGDKIYYFSYKKDSLVDCSWEDDTTPWDYIGGIGTHISGAPYLGNIHVAKIYAPTKVREDDAIVYIEFISNKGVTYKTGGIYIKKEDINNTNAITFWKFTPEYNSRNCDKAERGSMIMYTDKMECHVAWSACWNNIFDAIEYEKCKIDLWKQKLIKWSDMEKETYNNI